MKSVGIPLPVLGVDMLSDQTALRAGTVRSATNTDLANNGAFSRRAGFSTVAAGSGYTNLYTDAKGTLVGQGTSLYAINPTTYATALMCDMGAEAPIDFAQYNGHLYICGPRALWWIPSNESTPRPVGVPTGTLPNVASSNAGTLIPGNYAVAISRVDDRGEESPIKLLGTFALVAGLTLTNLTVTSGWRYRLYISPTDGDALYLADEWDALLSTHTATVTPNGAPCGNLHLAPMPYGDFVRAEKGRMYVAVGDTLWFSEPLRPHLTDPRHNFVRFVGNIRFIETMQGGVFVGDSRGVWWLSGEDPSKFTLRGASDHTAVKRSSLVVPTSVLGARFRAAEGTAAVWLSTAGYMVGSESGEVTPLHPDRVRLSGSLEGKSVFIVRNGIRQVITLTAAPTTTPIFGVALDTLIQ